MAVTIAISEIAERFWSCIKRPLAFISLVCDSRPCLPSRFSCIRIFISGYLSEFLTTVRAHTWSSSAGKMLGVITKSYSGVIWRRVIRKKRIIISPVTVARVVNYFNVICRHIQPLLSRPPHDIGFSYISIIPHHSSPLHVPRSSSSASDIGWCDVRVIYGHDTISVL